MKAHTKYQIAAVGLMVALGLSSISVNAQYNDSDRGHKKEYKYEKKKDYKYKDRSYKSVHKDYRAQDEYRAYDRDRYYNRVPDRHEYDNRCEVYHHPQYGNVYRKFYSTPIRLKHAHGDIFYHGGYYYNYYPRVGYVRISLPSSYVFVNLPGHCERFYDRGHAYFKYDNLVFEQCDHGYRLTPHFSLSLSAHF